MSKHSQSRQERQLAPRRRPQSFRPCLEVLEDRVLLSATLTVTTTNDTGAGSLRAALTQNVSDGGGDTIVFASGLNGTISLRSTLSIAKSATIANPNADNITINGGGKVEDLSVSGSSTVVGITGTSAAGAGSLTFTDGGGTSNGGAIAVATGSTLNLTDLTVSGSTASAAGTTAANTLASGGGISNAGTLMLTGVTVSGNTATGSGLEATAEGGGISNTGALTINGGSVIDNAATTPDGTILAQGGGIQTNGITTVTVSGTKITGNAVRGGSGLAYGGGLDDSGQGNAEMHISATTITDNTVTTGGAAAGGGIDGISMSISNSNISDNVVNSGGGFGGGIADGTPPILENGIGSFGVGGNLVLTSSTVAGNSIAGAATNLLDDSAGGGIEVFSFGALTATNDTLWNNNITEAQANDGNILDGGGLNLESVTQTALINDTVGDNTLTLTGSGSPVVLQMNGGGIANAGTLNLVNTLVSDPAGPTGSPDVFGTIANAQNDVFGSETGATITNNSGSHVQDNIAAQLGMLTTNGGPTPTVALLGSFGPGSNHDYAIGGGTSTSSLGTVPTVDQRGDPRPGPNGFDVGAFQTESTPPTSSPTSSPMPTTAPATTTVVSVVSDSFGLGPLFGPQTEQVKVSVTSGGNPVNVGSVTISDGGQNQTVPVSNGSASATFTFKLPQEASTAGSHTVTATYSDGAGGTVFAGSMGSTQSGNNSTEYEWLLLIDVMIAAVFGL
jgi:hypothetical protein